MTTPITVARETPQSESLRALVGLLDAELLERYGPAQAQFNPHNTLATIDAVVIAHRRGEPIGCGCFRRHDADSVEVKRMFVRRDQRGSGAAGLILDELERWARETGYKRCVLETGTAQPEAIRFYQKCGYTPIANYGPYVEIALSVCMEKALPLW